MNNNKCEKIENGDDVITVNKKYNIISKMIDY